MGASTVTFELDSLQPTNTVLYRAHLDKDREPNEAPPEVFVFGDLRILVDGHHRAGRRLLEGSSTIDAIPRTREHYDSCAHFTGGLDADYFIALAELRRQEGITSIKTYFEKQLFQ